MFNPLLFFAQGERRLSLPTVIKIDTRIVEGASTDANSFLLPINSFAGTIDWGDGTQQNATSVGNNGIKKIYSSPGEKIITITKNSSSAYFSFFYNADRVKLLEIIAYGTGMVLNTGSFAGAKNLKISSATGVAKVGTTMHSAFSEMLSLTNIQNLENINTSNLLTAQSAFMLSPNFNNKIVLNAPNLTTTYRMLDGCTSFNSDIIVNAPELVDMEFMLRNATAFNKDISGWVFNKNVKLGFFMAGKTASNYNPVYLDAFLATLKNTVVGTGRTQSTKVANFGTIKRTAASNNDYNALIADGWTIQHGGLI